MKFLFLLLVVAFSACAKPQQPVATTAAKPQTTSLETDDSMSIVGAWKAIADDEHPGETPANETIVLYDDTRFLIEGDEPSIRGFYKVEGDKITFTLSLKGIEGNIDRKFTFEDGKLLLANFETGYTRYERVPHEISLWKRSDFWETQNHERMTLKVPEGWTAETTATTDGGSQVLEVRSRDKTKTIVVMLTSMVDARDREQDLDALLKIAQELQSKAFASATPRREENVKRFGRTGTLITNEDIEIAQQHGNVAFPKAGASYCFGWKTTHEDNAVAMVLFPRDRLGEIDEILTSLEIAELP